MSVKEVDKKMVILPESAGFAMLAIYIAKRAQLPMVLEDHPKIQDRVETYKAIMDANGVKITEGDPADGFDVKKALEQDKLVWEKIWDKPLKMPQIDPALQSHADTFEGKTLLVPGKLISDEFMGKTAKEQSLPLQFWKQVLGENVTPVCGQHFAKDQLDESVKKPFLQAGWNTEIFDPKDKFGLLGFRGVSFEKNITLYKAVDKIIGTPGTHLWQALCFCPEKVDLTVYREGLERWDKILAPFTNKHISFNKETNLEDLADTCKGLK